MIITLSIIIYAEAQNVGIGITNPLMRLHVAKADSAVALLENTQALNLNISNALYFKTGSGSFPYTGALKTIGQSSSEARLGLFTYAAGTANELLERLSITDAGKVGIGTTAPAGKLHVVTTESNGDVANWGTGQLVIGGNGTQAGALGLSYSNTNNTAYISALTPNVAWRNLGFRSKNTSFYYNGTFEGMRLDSTGNVGIGTIAPSAKLEVAGQIKITGGSPGNGKVLTSDLNGLASWQSPQPSPAYYNSITICYQSWMTKNLNVATYRNGDAIPKVTDAAAWVALTTGAYCYYNNDSITYAAAYGKIYNWYAVNDPRGLAPEGWHIPTEFEYTTLGSCLGGNALAGGIMKEIGITQWTSPNTGATNYSGFTALPGGWRDFSGPFNEVGLSGLWWTSTTHITITANARTRFVTYNGTVLDGGFFPNKRVGLSVRCIRD